MDEFGADVVGGFFLKRKKAFSVYTSGVEHKLWKVMKLSPLKRQHEFLGTRDVRAQLPT